MENYADAAGRLMHARVPDRVPSGWCSWYMYFQNVDDKGFMKNLEWLDANRHSLPVDVVQLDGGYEEAWGDWTRTKRTFPSGLKAVASEVRERGFIPGLWIAPFSVEHGSRLHKEHPEWLIRNSSGFPVVCGVVAYRARPFYGLDCTRADVREWIGDVCRTAVEQWGSDT